MDTPAPPPEPALMPPPPTAAGGDESAGFAAALERIEDRLGQLDARLTQVLRLMEEQITLQRAAFLEEGQVLRFLAGNGARIALALPDALHDYVQRVILRTGTFFEGALLARVGRMGLLRPGGTVLDVGANIGNHTVFFGAVMGAGRLVAFEPQAHCAGLLARNLALNGLSERAEIHRCLVGAAPGRGRLAGFQPRNLGGAAFEADAEGEVPMTSLDAAIPPEARAGVDLVKIDVEGMQMQVLEGARGLLESARPALWIELREGEEASMAAGPFLSGFGYEALRLGPTDFLFRAARPDVSGLPAP